MQIRIEELPEKGLEVVATPPEDWPKDPIRQALEGEPVGFEVAVVVNRIVPDSPTLRVRGRAMAAAARHCDRCGAPIHHQVEGDVDLFYVPEGHGLSGAEQLHEDELDLGWYNGNVLEMADVLVEQLALWTPERVRCVDDGVSPQVDDPKNHRCALAEQEEVELERPSPFAGLRLKS